MKIKEQINNFCDNLTRKEYVFVSNKVSDKELYYNVPLVLIGLSMKDKSLIHHQGIELHLSPKDDNEMEIRVSLTDNEWTDLLNLCKINDYKLVIKNDKNKMYFTKVKEA